MSKELKRETVDINIQNLPLHESARLAGEQGYR